MKQARHRLGQFLRYLQDNPLAPADQAEVRQVLAPRLRALFERMTPGEQRHSLRVLRALRAQAEAGALPAGLLEAALLHDVGKTCAPLGLLGRVLVVLARRWLPAHSLRWGQGQPRGWRRPFVTAAQHPAWGAELCAAAGAGPLAVALVRRHQDPLRSARATPEDDWLALLQQADDNN